MFIFKIFRIRKQVKNIREGAQDPAGFAGKQATDIVRGYVIILAFFTIIILSALFILGFTDFLIESSIVARVLFWILFIPLLLFWSLISVTLRQLKRLAKEAKEKVSRETIHVKAEVKDPETLE